ncbi:MAG TPA: RsmE family RNA methyltransferase [Terriglobales bacterium]|nr:RsmE family RNA methyltransferase [Terriglobales bacterium]
MTRRRWIADEVHDNRAVIVGDHADHLVRVLRARLGQIFDISTGRSVRSGRIASIEEARVEFELGDEVGTVALPNVSVVLAIFKFDRMEWAIEKATELGVARILPFCAERSDRHLVVAARKRVERWRRLARQASEQSRRETIPEITDPLTVREAVSCKGTVRVFLSENERAIRLTEVLGSTEGQAGMALAVGPEGGWAPQEEKEFRETGWRSASLGSQILRTETAVISALAVVFSELS